MDFYSWGYFRIILKCKNFDLRTLTNTEIIKHIIENHGAGDSVIIQCNITTGWMKNHFDMCTCKPKKKIKTPRKLSMTLPQSNLPKSNLSRTNSISIPHSDKFSPTSWKPILPGVVSLSPKFLARRNSRTPPKTPPPKTPPPKTPPPKTPPPVTLEMEDWNYLQSSLKIEQRLNKHLAEKNDELRIFLKEIFVKLLNFQKEKDLQKIIEKLDMYIVDEKEYNDVFDDLLNESKTPEHY